MIQDNLKAVLFLGNYDENFARNAILINAMKNKKIKVHEFNIRSYNIIKNFKICLKNYKKLKTLDYDIIFMHNPTIFQLIFAKILSKIKKAPVVHDIFISKLQTMSHDRNLFDKNKMPKFLYPFFLYLQDILDCFLSDYIILDTNNHIKFFHEKFKVPLKKFKRIFVGAQDNIFFPLDNVKKEGNDVIVGFWGTYIPLQGIKFIIQAAKLLETDNQIKFFLIGNGQTYKENRSLAHSLNLNNIKFIDFQPLKRLPKLIAKFDIGLGIFGQTEKTMQVIPNKIFHGIAMKIPMITCESPAIKELFKDNENIILCERANPDSLAKAILKLKNDNLLREKIKEGAYNIYLESTSTDAISKELYGLLNSILRKK